MKIRCGTAGWTIPKPFADQAPLPGAHLERYARVFPCAEINSSFYRPHRVTTWHKWAASVPEDFRFAVKAPRTITHEARLACSAQPIDDFLAQFHLLGAKLGPLLFQLPPKLALDPAVVETFLVLLRNLHPGGVVFEPRHASWFTPEAEALFAQFEVARAAVDPALTPEATSPGGWNQLVYHRLHGSPRVYYSAYGEQFLQPLARTLALQSQGADVWCIFDNTASGAAFGDSLTVHRLLQP